MIIQEIKIAFGDVSYPGTECIVNDWGGKDLERCHAEDFTDVCVG